MLILSCLRSQLQCCLRDALPNSLAKADLSIIVTSPLLKVLPTIYKYCIYLPVYCLSLQHKVYVCKALVLFTSVPPGPPTMHDTYYVNDNFVAKSNENSVLGLFLTGWVLSFHWTPSFFLGSFFFWVLTLLFSSLAPFSQCAWEASLPLCIL